MSEELNPSQPTDRTDLSDQTDPTGLPDPPGSHFEIDRKTRRAFLWAAGAVGATFGAWRWLVGQEKRAGALGPLRSALEFNEGLWSSIFSSSRLSPTFPKSQAKEPRPNGRIGLKSDLDTESFHLGIEFPNNRKDLSVKEIKELGAIDVVTELRCIEGWSEVVHWTGIPLGNLIDKTFGPEWLEHSAGYLNNYVYAETPLPAKDVKDKKYFVGLDIESALHPQTLVCWAMNGKDLEIEHGAPLRLVVPTKYGIKSLKRVGLIRFTDERPDDYWYREGYDWYAGF